MDADQRQLVRHDGQALGPLGIVRQAIALSVEIVRLVGTHQERERVWVPRFSQVFSCSRPPPKRQGNRDEGTQYADIASPALL